MEEASPHFRLLDLPPEIRLMIYELATVAPTPIQVTEIKVGEELVYDPQLCYPPALARVCQSIRTDVTKIFYTQNTFEGDYCTARGCHNVLLRWLRRVESRHRGSLKLILVDRVAAIVEESEDCLEYLRKELEAGEFGRFDLHQVDRMGTFRLSFNA